jgi:putative RecB family exonuclease
MFKLSPFRLKVFHQCRRRYKYRYVERIPTRPSAHNTVGAHVHTALKLFFDSVPLDDRSPQRLVDLLLSQWQTNRAGFQSLADEEQWRERAQGMLERFGEEQDLAAQPLILERHFELTLNPRLALIGRIDRVDQENGALHVIDYKTGRQPNEVDDDQLHLYTVLLERTLLESVARASYLYLEDGKLWSVTPTAERVRASLEAAEEAYREMIAEREYAASVGRHCAFCEYQSICPRREEIVGRRLAEGW